MRMKKKRLDKTQSTYLATVYHYWKQKYKVSENSFD